MTDEHLQLSSVVRSIWGCGFDALCSVHAWSLLSEEIVHGEFGSAVQEVGVCIIDIDVHYFVHHVLGERVVFILDTADGGVDLELHCQTVIVFV